MWFKDQDLLTGRRPLVDSHSQPESQLALQPSAHFCKISTPILVILPAETIWDFSKMVSGALCCLNLAKQSEEGSLLCGEG